MIDSKGNLDEIIKCVGCRGQNYQCDKYVYRKTPKALYGECYWYSIMQDEYAHRLYEEKESEQEGMT